MRASIWVIPPRSRCTAYVALGSFLDGILAVPFTNFLDPSFLVCFGNFLEGIFAIKSPASTTLSSSLNRIRK